MPEDVPVIFTAGPVRSEILISGDRWISPGFGLAHDRNGEFCEALTSLLLWLCGLITVAFCLL
jgi:hypothetical protein